MSTRLTRREVLVAGFALTVVGCTGDRPDVPPDRWFVTTVDRVYDTWFRREYVLEGPAR